MGPCPETSGRPNIDNSFTADTEVLLADGTSKPINQLQPGDEVTATNEHTGETAARQVVATIEGTGHKTLVDIGIDTDGDHHTDATITATDHHPIWAADPATPPHADHTNSAARQVAVPTTTVPTTTDPAANPDGSGSGGGGPPTPSAEPLPGQWTDAINLTTGQLLHTNTGTWVQITDVHVRTQHTTVYNLTIADLHTYHVLAGNTPVPAHNCGNKVDGPLPDRGQTSLYPLHNPATGEILKWGISKNPTTRYTCDCLERLGARMQIIENFDSRADALAAERYMTERFPGPENREPWAGSVKPNGTWQDALRYVRSGGLWRGSP